MLFTCVLLGLSSAPIYAASGEDPSPEASSFDLVIPEEYLDPVYDKLASGDVRAIEYTTTDIYNLLSSALNGSSYLSAYSLPQIASQVRRISTLLYGSGQNVPSSGNLYTIMAEIHEILNGRQLGVYVRPDIQSALFRTDQQANFITVADDLGSTVEFLQLLYSSAQQIHADGQNNSYYLSQIANSISHDIDWVNCNATSFAPRQEISGSDVSSGWYTHLFFRFLVPSSSATSTPSFFRIFIPFSLPGTYVSTPDINLGLIRIWNNNSLISTLGTSDYFCLSTDNGFYIYLPDFHFTYNSGTYFFEITAPTTFYYNSSYGVNVYSVPFNTYDYQLMKQAFYNEKTAKSIGSVSDAANSLANYLVSPDKQAAENASQPVIDDTLDGFTGSGSAAAKTSDTGGMKNMSGSLQSGLDTGASASNAASVFSNTTFWTWFTQDNSNKINQPYPAPVVPQFRGSGDQIVDFLSGNQAELNELLNQRNSW